MKDVKDGAASRSRRTARQRAAWCATSVSAKCSAMQWRSRGPNTAAMSSAEYGAMTSSMPSARSTSCWSRVKIRCAALVVQVRIERGRRRVRRRRVEPVRGERVGRPFVRVARRVAHRVDFGQQGGPVSAERRHAHAVRRGDELIQPDRHLAQHRARRPLARPRDLGFVPCSSIARSSRAISCASGLVCSVDQSSKRASASRNACVRA